MSIILLISGITGMMNLYALSINDFDREKTRSDSISYPITLTTGLVLAFMFCAAIIYRTFLIYNLWSNQEFTLQNQSSIINDEDKTDRQSNKTLKRITITILIISFIFTLITLPGFVSADLLLLRKLFPIPFVIVIIYNCIYLFFYELFI